MPRRNQYYRQKYIKYKSLYSRLKRQSWAGDPQCMMCPSQNDLNFSIIDKIYICQSHLQDYLDHNPDESFIKVESVNIRAGEVPKCMMCSGRSDLAFSAIDKIYICQSDLQDYLDHNPDESFIKVKSFIVA
jgi:hypothetical protein